jgi:hypothetical protein
MYREKLTEHRRFALPLVMLPRRMTADGNIRPISETLVPTGISSEGETETPTLSLDEKYAYSVLVQAELVLKRR